MKTPQKTSMLGRSLFVFLLVLWLLPASAVHADPIRQMVIFGDSLSDTGNVFTATGGTFPPSPPYAGGRFSNGPLWIEYLATQLGVPAPLPVQLGGMNYAHAGATTGVEGDLGAVPNVATQVALYLASQTPDPGDLFVLWSGANDLFNGVTDPSIPVNTLANAISSLVQAGARQILVAKLPPLERTPFALTQLSPVEQAGLAALTQEFNTRLDAQMDQLEAQHGLVIHRLDVFGLFQGILADPGSHGFTNTTQQGILQPPGTDVTGFLFWDTVHPTTTGHEFLANQAFQLLPTPEPSTWMLVVSAGLAMLPSARRWRQGGHSTDC